MIYLYFVCLYLFVIHFLCQTKMQWCLPWSINIPFCNASNYSDNYERGLLSGLILCVVHIYSWHHISLDGFSTDSAHELWAVAFMKLGSPKGCKIMKDLRHQMETILNSKKLNYTLKTKTQLISFMVGLKLSMHRLIKIKKYKSHK